MVKALTFIRKQELNNYRNGNTITLPSSCSVHGIVQRDRFSRQTIPYEVRAIDESYVDMLLRAGGKSRTHWSRKLGS